MNAAMSGKDVARAIEGVTALCLGSADKLVWVDHADAAAFADGERMYLPRPTGLHAQEYELLLALALREVAKLSSTDTTALTGDSNVLPYSTVIEEVRLKASLAGEYRGAPRIFNTAVTIAGQIFAESASAGKLTPEQIKTLAVWAASHRALLGTAEAQANQTLFEEMARSAPGAEGLDEAIQLAMGGPATRSSAEADALGQQIWAALNTKEQPPPDDQAGQDAGKDESQPQAEDNTDGADPVPDQQAADDRSEEGTSQEGHPPEDRSAAEGGQQQDESDAMAGPEGQQEADGADQDGQEGKDGGGGDSGADSPKAEDGSPGDAAGSEPTSESPAEVPGGQEGSSESMDQQGAATGAAEPAPADGAGGPDNTAQAGSDGTPTTDSEGSAGGGNADSSAAAGDPSGESVTPQGGRWDPLSDALAKLKGHAQATDYSARAAELREEAAGVEPLSEAAVAAVRELMESPDTDLEQLLIAAATPEEQGEAAEPAESAEPAASLASMLCGGDGLAEAENNAGRALLDAIPARLVTVLLRELQDVKRRPFIRAASGPKVSVTQVWRLKRLGDVRVFKKRVAASGIDAAVAILLDRSGSMRDNGFETAVEVVHAFILALQRISGVKTSLDVFPGAVAESEQVLEFKQNLNAVTKHLRSIEPDGGTPTGTAMATRLARLIETRAEKKIMVVVTDGMPEFGQLPIVGAVMARAAMEDVDVIGIGIGVEVQHLFPMSINVSSVGELPNALAELLQGDFAKRLAA
ncbi:MAG: VWA domain-containing protein [Burkholderiaceae bacterium]|nr:VWA domain-containing protein [Burkholderiaceae bacterium]MDP3139471.1 VWA domain-containing protein [Burkholderiaceae bacterium]